MKILLASSNPHKRHEFRQLFTGHEILLPEEVGLSFDCEENGETFLDNALIKANALFEKAENLGIPVMADDSGLIVPSLPGLLGVRTARFGSENGKPLLSAHEKNLLLIKMLEGKTDAERDAFFVCAIVLISQRNRIHCAVENTAGRILERESEAAGGFGYDPVFFCNEAGCAMAELPDGEKNLYSHRGKAARSILKMLD